MAWFFMPYCEMKIRPTTTDGCGSINKIHFGILIFTLVFFANFWSIFSNLVWKWRYLREMFWNLFRFFGFLAWTLKWDFKTLKGIIRSILHLPYFFNFFFERSVVASAALKKHFFCSSLNYRLRNTYFWGM